MENFKYSNPDEIKKNRTVIEHAIATDETAGGENQELDMGAFAKTFNEDIGEKAEDLFFTPIKDRIEELNLQIESLQQEIEDASGTKNLSAFNGLIMQGDELKKYDEALSRELESITEQQRQDPAYVQKIQHLELTRQYLHSIAEHVNELSPTISPEREAELEKQIEELRLECSQFTTFLEKIQTEFKPGGDRPINFN
jgi:hypothetical protein